eukprot:COSAG02_NODE_843_length_16599_cov_6.528485_2_plen_61_part_00
MEAVLKVPALREHASALVRDDAQGGARHSQRVSGAVLNLILGHPGVFKLKYSVPTYPQRL